MIPGDEGQDRQTDLMKRPPRDELRAGEKSQGGEPASHTEMERGKRLKRTIGSNKKVKRYREGQRQSGYKGAVTTAPSKTTLARSKRWLLLALGRYV